MILSRPSLRYILLTYFFLKLVTQNLPIEVLYGCFKTISSTSFHVRSVREKCTKIRILIIGPSGAGNELYRYEVTATRTLHLWSQGIKYYLLDSANPTKFYTEIFSTTFLSFKSWAYSYHGNKIISILGDRCIRQEGHCYLCACATNQSFSKDPGT